MTLVDMTTHEILYNYKQSFFFIYDWSPDSTHFAFIGEDRKGYIADINGNILPTPDNLDAFRTAFRWFDNESYFYCGKDSGLYWSSINNINYRIRIIDKLNCAVDYDYYVQ
jgi:hypothetical protein